MATLKEKVYECLLAIPRGKVTTYGQIAEYLGNKNLAIYNYCFNLRKNKKMFI